jgi:MYXO-CTERM domain-containing protein
MVSGATNPGVDVSLTIQQSATPGYDYDFVVSNSSVMGIVTGVYFEMDWNSMLGSGTNAGDASLIKGTATPQIADWAGTKSSHVVDKVGHTVRISRGSTHTTWYDDLSDGIQEGGSHVFSFTSSALSLADLESMLGTDGYGVAIRMQGLTEDAQAKGWGEVDEAQQQLLLAQSFSPVQQEEGDNGSNGETKVAAAPSPTAALAGLVVAGIAGLRRRRK